MFIRPCRVLVRWSRQTNKNRVSFSKLATVEPPREETHESSEQNHASKIIHGRGIFQATYHPRTHNVPVAVVHFRSYTPSQLDLFTHFATHAAASLAIPVSRPVYLPTQRSLWTVLKGPFAHKKSQENFERKVHKRAIKAWDANELVVDRWLKYLQQHLLAGVGMRSTRWQRVPVGVGEHTLKTLTEQMRLDSIRDSEKVKTLGDKIIQQESSPQEEELQSSEPLAGS